MNSLVLLVVALCVFALAYRFYSAFLAAKVLMLNDTLLTPAHRLNDGRDYVPTNKWVVFGHHFAAIAGAGPLVGPVLAAQYGWGPGFLWILIGSVFAGCVHDMIILFGSVRHDGHSISMIARRNVSRLTGALTSVAILFIIVVALAGLAAVVVKILVKNPWGVFSIGMTIPIAMAVGWYMFKIRPGAIVSGSIAGVLLVCASVFVGPAVAQSGCANWFMMDDKTLSILLPVYGFLAAALPVWLLLAPRDYLSTYMKIGVVVVMAVGLLFIHPTIKMDFVTKFIHGGGPIVSGPWWPYVFITIACGAISGFHALIGSGTTPKLIEKETQIRAVGYGAMLTEAFVSLMALIAATTLVPQDYYAIISKGPVVKQQDLHAHVAGCAWCTEAEGMADADRGGIRDLEDMIGMPIRHRTDGGVALAAGMIHIFAGASEKLRPFMRYLFQFITMFEALFILTTIDAGTRVARYILQDIFAHVWKPLGRVNWMPGVIVTSALVSLAWGYLLYTGDVQSIWPIFGATNQTLSAMALAIGTTLILRIARRKSYALVAAIPCAFLTVTTFAADILNIRNYHAQGKPLSVWLSVCILAIVSVVIADNIRVWMKLLKTREPVGLNNGPEKPEPVIDMQD